MGMGSKIHETPIIPSALTDAGPPLQLLDQAPEWSLSSLRFKCHRVLPSLAHISVPATLEYFQAPTSASADAGFWPLREVPFFSNTFILFSGFCT